MLKKQIILFSIALLLLAGFFALPANKNWGMRIWGYAGDFPEQVEHMDRESRMVRRFGYNYAYSKEIAKQLALKGDPEQALVLLPPTTYFFKKGLRYQAPEPAVFYYYTGVKTIATSSKEAVRANWYVRADKRKIIVGPVPHRDSVQPIIDSLK